MRYVLDIPFWYEMEGRLPDETVNAHTIEIITDEILSRGDQIDLDGRLLVVANRRMMMKTQFGERDWDDSGYPIKINHIQLFCQNV